MATARPDLGSLVAAHQAEIWRYLRFLGSDDALASDLTQETFLAVLRNPPDDLPSRAAAGAYLRTVARNLFLKSRRRKPLVSLDDPSLDEAWIAFAADDGGMAYVDALKSCIETLESRERTALEMKYGRDAGAAELGRELGLGTEGVKTLIRRIKETLRRCVEGKRHE